jgi:sulfatase modifying factor 1
MKFFSIVLLLLVVVIGQAAVPPQTEKLLSKQQLLELLSGGVPNQRAAELVKERGIDFEVDDNYVRALSKAGANKALITAVQEASSAAKTQLVVGTSPGAQVYLDGILRGQADAQGQLTLSLPPGSHALTVELAGKKDFAQIVTLASGQANKIQAGLVDAPGSIRIQTLPGASVILDNAPPATADAGGNSVLADVPAGTHNLRVSAHGKVDVLRTVVVAPGTEAQIEISLRDSLRVNPRDGLAYVWIPPGTFMMGCSPGDHDCAAVEIPAHQVTLTKAFWIGQSEVTVGAYKRYVAAASGKMPPDSPKQYKGWKDDNLPMVDVTWGEARDYCTWAAGRLPTEAEWEYAARGGTPDARYGDLNAIAWNKMNSANQTHDVAGKSPNAFGLFDVLGNVWEWVNDWYDPHYYPSSPSQDPAGPASGLERVQRGGSWIVDPTLLRLSDRYSYKPDARSDFFGFRCARQEDDR